MSPVQLEKGLADESSLLMIPTMVDILPQGYASLDSKPWLHLLLSLQRAGYCLPCCRNFMTMHDKVCGTFPKSREPVAICRHESGEYYAIDVGGTNLRVLYVRLGAQPKSVVQGSPLLSSEARGRICIVLLPGSHPVKEARCRGAYISPEDPFLL